MNSEELSDQRLVQRAQQGDNRAFDMLVLKYQSRMANVVSRYIKDHHEIADVTQEAFVKAFRALPNFRGDAQFYTWLYRIAINTAKNFLVAKTRRPPDVDKDIETGEFSDVSGVLEAEDRPDQLLSRDQLQAVVVKALADLPEDIRTALTLREFDGLSYEEIASIMECPVGTVRSRIFRGREAVEKKIEEMG
ncbi:MAG: RNA polymerase sigma factor RpoE [Proteobacteria bacterium]|nr:RNA polymerase sigma factor RpoE [Pseudomonadota bacterium]MDA1207543.1 RNA polymerase sigma factor RpoE [Pseudomonadota bacterium]